VANSKGACTGCKKRFDRDSLFVTPVGSKFCTRECATKYIYNKKNRAQSRAKVLDKECKEAGKALKELNQRTMSWQEEATQKAFNKMRKAEEILWFQDNNLEITCISCGKPKGRDIWACGHYKTQGGNSRLRYDRVNTYIQHNTRCNSELSGNISGTKTTHGYTKGLLIRFGEVKGQQIIDYCESNTHPIKRTCEELQQMRKEFNQCYRDTIKLIDN
tara:strand:+ start:58 stop:708 length:651 start_codon:yes stop_codon:yes gene_type:complete